MVRILQQQLDRVTEFYLYIQFSYKVCSFKPISTLCIFAQDYQGSEQIYGRYNNIVAKYDIQTYPGHILCPKVPLIRVQNGGSTVTS